MREKVQNVDFLIFWRWISKKWLDRFW